ncbi:hypothetical protein CYY_001467 [Polysphondylium violaceum]|uniref:Uncharacterized protein n=1 Tax=Polysphondylium violaceum TaxID=133409 RepID=A0A8J4PZS4_9MYCE|nr:hypothetical protein CYY_001467 [Polysphondylium violaceum]
MTNNEESVADRFKRISENKRNRDIQQQQQKNQNVDIESNDTSNNNNENIEALKPYISQDLEKRKLELEKEIYEINSILSGTAPRSTKVSEANKAPEKHWYSDYKILNDTFNHPDYDKWKKSTSIIAFTGLVYGGATGYTDAVQYIKESIAKNVNNPMNLSSIQLNSRRTIGLMVFKNSLLYSYRLGLYSGVFLGVESILKNNVFGESILNKTMGGTAVGVITGMHVRKRGGPIAFGSSVAIGTVLGFLMGASDILLDNYIFKKEKVGNSIPVVETTPSNDQANK